MKHTKTPWKIIKRRVPKYVNGFVYSISGVCDMFQFGHNAKAKANAERIVKAVNGFDELLDQLIKTNFKLLAMIDNNCIKGVGLIHSTKAIIRSNDKAIKKTKE